MVNDDSPLYTQKIRCELNKLGTYFLPIYKGSVLAKNPLPPFEIAAKTKFASLCKASWTSSAFGASISLNLATATLYTGKP